MNGLFEELDWYIWHAHERSRVLHALSILLWPEDSYGIISRASVCLQAFVALHAIIEAWSHAMQAEEWILYKLRRGPLANFNGVLGFDVTIDCGDGC